MPTYGDLINLAEKENCIPAIYGGVGNAKLLHFSTHSNAPNDIWEKLSKEYQESKILNGLTALEKIDAMIDEWRHWKETGKWLYMDNTDYVIKGE